MGKATRWLKALFLTLRGPDDPARPRSRPPKEKRRWSFVKSYRDKSSSSSSNPNPNPNPLRPDSDDASKHAIVVADASAAAADAAVAAAQAAAAVVRLTATSRRVTPPSTRAVDRTSWAVVLIQSRFRGYLARRALKALKGLVKLQAHVRGHIERKRTAETMRRIQAMLRAQARARSVRSNDSPNSSGKSSQIHHHPGPPTPEKFEPSSYIRGTNGNHSGMLKGNGSRSIHRNLMHPDKGYVSSSWSGPQLGESLWDPRGRHTQYHHHHHHPREDYYIRPDKILEVDTGKPAPQFSAKHRKNPNPFESTRGGLDFYSDQLTQSFTTTTSREDSYTHQTTVPSPGSCEVQSGFNTNTLKLSVQDEDLDDDGAFCTAENSPRMYSSSSRRRRGTHTPTKSDASATSCFSGYSDCPSYMNYTESSRAKMRSMSAPRQRPQQQQQQQQCYERGSSMKRWSVHQQRAVVGLGSGSGTMQASFASRAYPGSGHLDRLGMPVRNSNAVVYYSGYLN